MKMNRDNSSLRDAKEFMEVCIDMDSEFTSTAIPAGICSIASSLISISEQLNQLLCIIEEASKNY